MSNIKYHKLQLEECHKIKEINPKQYIKNAWRIVEGKRQLVEIDYMENDWPDGYEIYHGELVKIVKANGAAFGAFDESGRMMGFASLSNKFFGETAKYVLLDALFVSYETRRLGIGKKLFNLCVEQAKEWKADKIYICAGSAEETISFYSSIGCIEALEINRELYEEDPRDMQLEFKI